MSPCKFQIYKGFVLNLFIAVVGEVAQYNPIELVLPRSLPEVAHH